MTLHSKIAPESSVKKGSTPKTWTEYDDVQIEAPRKSATHPESYADYLALGMQKADKALPGGSARRKEDYARSYANSRAPVEVPRPPALTYADFLAEARVRQAGAGFASKLLSVTDEQLAQADARIGWTNERARQRHIAKGGRA